MYPLLTNMILTRLTFAPRNYWNEFYVMKIKSNDKKSTINNKNNKKKSKIIHMTRRYLFSLRLLIFVKKWKERKGVEEQDVNRL